MPIITIDGNIGSGKTTILETLQKKFNQMISLEPVTEWKPYLNDIYKNNVGYFNFQLKVFLDRAFIQSKSNQIIFMERSPKFTRATFVEVYKDKFTTQEYNIIQHLYDNVDHQYNKTIIEPSIYIYIQTNPDICYKRIQERNRESESTINKDLIDKLHIKHEEYYDKIFKQGLSTYMINSDNLTPDEIAENIMNYIQGI
tara:strand:+ start:106 stop:702 length:597 start_codon:yes stop_codon:yes gene_type:complete